ncbi:MAG: DUF3109 family protein [Prevotella sp.]|nr:DUF3109 family protein [Prevotella sp.]
MNKIPPIIDVNGVLISSEIITERFCCDLESCKGACCVEGDAGAPVTLDEIGEIENSLDVVWEDMTASAQAVVDRQGVAYTDQEGDLVTSIVNGKDCVFTYYDDLEISNTQHPTPITRCCLCALEKAYREGRSKFCKPISCALYPIREKRFSSGLIGLNYHKWSVCECARKKGRELDLPVYKFLKDPLVRRFGQEWYDELETIAEVLASV